MISSMRPLVILFFALLISTIAASAKTTRQELDKVLLDKDLWFKSLEDIKAIFDPEPRKDDVDLKIPKKLREKLAKEGISVADLKDGNSGPFEWLSEQKKGLRSPGGNLSFLGMDIGEVVIRAKGETVSEVTLLIYNRGDDDTMRKSAYTETMSTWRRALKEELKVRDDDRDQSGRIAIDGSMWKKDDTAWLLEGSITRRENRVEFIRLRLASLSGASKSGGKLARRGSLEANVVKKDNGDVYVSGIPMVDQGQKGYCVVATIERVARYFGADVDQHEMASLANTSGNGGTSGDDMVKAFQRITGKIHVRTIKHIDYDNRQFEKDFKSYNRVAKREGVWYSDKDTDDWYLSPQWFWSKADKDVFRSMKAEQTKFEHFNRKIKEYVDEGIPMCWTLYLGMFPEKGLPQSWGGHMRLIIGYNEKTKEILYSDSWGSGHGMKRMRADEAWCMNMGLYSMVPNR